MDQTTFDRFRRVVYDKSGITLKEGKEALVAARVGKRMRTLGLESHEAYLDYVVDDASGEELVELLDAISTNVTSFFREPKHFEFIADVMEQWLRAGQRRFRFWSAASSTGEEPYTLAMVLREVTGSRNVDMRILGTDISTRVLDVCRAGIYDATSAKGIAPALLKRYMTPVRGNGAPCYAVRDTLKNMTLFRRLNLSQPPFPMRGPMDVILCRNVMIYFDQVIREGILKEAARLLKPGGYFIVGHAESLTGTASAFRTERPSVYRRE